MQLDNQTAIVTGASSGIGRAIALAFASEGANVAFCHLDDPQADAVADQIAAMGRKVFVKPVDLTDLGALETFMAEAQQKFGTPDILVNNAGGGRILPFTEITPDFYDQQVNLNFRAAVFATHAVLESMIKRGSGRIINISSQLGLRGESNMTLYASCKAAIVGLTRSLAREVSEHGVLVNAIAPGPIATERFLAAPEDKRNEIMARLPVKRFGTPEDIAATALMLAGSAGKFYAGACLSPNGGDVMH